MSPYLLLGFFFAGLLHAFIPRQKIENYFNGKPLKSAFLASVFGIPLPLCSCGVIPAGTSLYKNVASKGGTISFLISTPQTGVDSILATFSLMGLPFAIIRPFAALITGITGGWITSYTTSNEVNKTTETKEEASKSFLSRIVDTFHYGFVIFIQDIAKWLIIGLVLASAVSAIIPDSYFDVLKLSPFVQMLLVLAISIPLYICATGSIPLAAILLAKGISPGAAFVLLMAGPATNLATITVIGKVMGRKSLFSYLATIIVGALAFGLIIDYFLPLEWFAQKLSSGMAHEHGNALKWWQIASGIILISLIINGYIVRYIKSINTNTDQKENTNTLKVKGMTCNNCKSNIEKNLRSLDFVNEVNADLNSGKLVIQGENIDLQKVKETIESLGFEVVGK